MEQSNISILFLQGFAPLIQLWAAICLLFFYEPLLKNSPFSSQCNEIKRLYNTFLNQYNGLIPEKVINADEYVKDYWSKNFLPTIKCVASLCFFYSVFILAFIGIEGNSNYGGEYYSALQVTNTLVWIYIFIAITCYRLKFVHGFTPSIIFSIFLLIYFHFHFRINKFCLSFFELGSIWDRSSITIYTIFTCIGGIILVCLRLFISWIILQCQKRSVNNIYKEFQIFADYVIGKTKRDAMPKQKLGRIMKRCTEKFNNEDIRVIDASAFLDEMREEVKKEYVDFTNKWWIKLY